MSQLVVSVRHIAKNCLGISGTFGIYRNFFGYLFTRSDVSLRKQIELLQNKHFHVNLIFTGDQFEHWEKMIVEHQLRNSRSVYGSYDIGIGRVKYFHLSKHELEEGNISHKVLNDEGKAIISNYIIAARLRKKFSIPNHAVDVFVVHGLTILGKPRGGNSPIPGICKKNLYVNNDGITLVAVGDSLAHELGHYFGLHHNNSDEKNVMHSGGTGRYKFNSTELFVIDHHCFLNFGCT